VPATFDWITVELACAIVCACLPTYAPLLPRETVFPSLKSWYASLVNSFRSTNQSKSSKVQSSEYSGGGGSDDRSQDRPMGNDHVHLTKAVTEQKFMEQYWSWDSFPRCNIKVHDIV
jgi:hypothetical protein